MLMRPSPGRQATSKRRPEADRPPDKNLFSGGLRAGRDGGHRRRPRPTAAIRRAGRDGLGSAETGTAALERMGPETCPPTITAHFAPLMSAALAAQIRAISAATN